jgi:hypothetical protein
MSNEQDPLIALATPVSDRFEEQEACFVVGERAGTEIGGEILSEDEGGGSRRALPSCRSFCRARLSA